MSLPKLDSLNEGQSVAGVFMLARKQIAQTRAGKPFGALALSDASGEMDAKLWDRAEVLLEGLEPGCPVRVSGRVEVYNGKRQMVLETIEADLSADPLDFIPQSPVPFDELTAGFKKAQSWVGHKHLKKLLKAFFVEDKAFAKLFCDAPAAKGAHHAYRHGLLEHTVSVAKLARSVAGNYPELEPDLLIAGALLHDIGKAYELTLGPPLGYTDRGRLLGHVIIGVELLDEKLSHIKGFPEELADELRHLILSHHGEYAFGSPKRPKTPAALALHFLDDMDAKLTIYREVMNAEAGQNGNWSNFNRLLERFLYLGPNPLAAQGQSSSDTEDKAPCQPGGLFDRADQKPEP